MPRARLENKIAVARRTVRLTENEPVEFLARAVAAPSSQRRNLREQLAIVGQRALLRTKSAIGVAVHPCKPHMGVDQ
jgi:hypothetical protein